MSESSPENLNLFLVMWLGLLSLAGALGALLWKGQNERIKALFGLSIKTNDEHVHVELCKERMKSTDTKIDYTNHRLDLILEAIEKLDKKVDANRTETFEQR